MSARILIWTQHLLGVGHFMRTAHIAQGLGESGFEVVVASGGVTPAGFGAKGFRLAPLPAVQAKDAFFDALVDGSGADVTIALMDQRRQMLLSLHDMLQPDCIITETFPFGRRLVEDEVLALLARVRESGRRVRIVASVRDVLQRPRKDARARAMVARAREAYDSVLVHGDPTLIPVDHSFPEMASIDDLVHYTGYVGPAWPAPQDKRRGVIVSAGGGAVGQALLSAAVAAKPLTRLNDEEWLMVSGPLSQPRSQAASGIRFVRSLPDLPAQLARSALSISQAGYNTMTETLAARTPCVAVPFETDREREQITRAQRLAALDLVSVVRSCDLAPEALARAVDERMDRGMAAHGVNLNGVAGTVSAIRILLGDA